ncbi:MAG: MotA/TolQ/ExbB proton channel family protein [Steroidobacteraceae bacterium]
MHEIYSFLLGIRSGGFFIYPVILVFVVGVAIAIERFIFLTVETQKNRSLWANLVPHLGAGNFKKVLELTRDSTASIASVLNYGIARLAHARRRDDIEKAMDESMLEIIPRMEKRTHYLGALANVGMLLGLLGTVVGLISAFASIATANPAEKATLLAASISVAMNCTASGLICAITLLLSHMYLDSKTTSLIDSLEIASVKFLNSVVERREDAVATPVPPAPSPRPAAPARGMA